MAFVAKGCSLKQAAANSVAFKFNTKARLSVQSVIDEVSEGDGCRSYALMRSSNLHQTEPPPNRSLYLYERFCSQIVSFYNISLSYSVVVFVLSPFLPLFISLFISIYLLNELKDALMEICLENGVDDYELRSEVDGCPLSPQQEGQVRFCI